MVIVPINFRLVGPEIEYIVNNSDARALIVHDEFTPTVDSIKTDLVNIGPDHYIAVGKPCGGYKNYEAFIENAPADEPDVRVDAEDTWILIYTSGTTGKPKGVVRSHASHISFYLINGIDFGFTEHDVCMNVMPLCHINSTFFTFTFTYIGATVYIHPARSFRPEEILEIIEREKITFISLIPTHYNLILNGGRIGQTAGCQLHYQTALFLRPGPEGHEAGHPRFLSRRPTLRRLRVHGRRASSRCSSPRTRCKNSAPSAMKPWERIW